MDSRISVITLGVNDLQEAARFYKNGIGFTCREDISSEYVTFFQMNGFLLALYPKQLLAEDAGVPLDSRGFSGITLAQNVDTNEQVDQLLEQALSAGAVITKPAEEKPWGGYSGYFKDIEGYLWEIGCYPDLDTQQAS